jgi:hypothetical protein
MAGDFFGQGIGDHFAGALLVFDPGGMGKSDGDGVAIDQEVDVDGIGVASGEGYDQALVEAVDRLFGPAVGGGEVCEHRNWRRSVSDKYIVGRSSVANIGEDDLPRRLKAGFLTVTLSQRRSAAPAQSDGIPSVVFLNLSKQLTQARDALLAYGHAAIG